MTLQSPAVTPEAKVSTQVPASVNDALAAFKARRSELNSQLLELTVRRDLLTQQLRNASGTDAQQLNAQLAIVSQRNNQVLKSLGDIDDAVNKLLANAPVVVSSSQAPAIAELPPPPPPIGGLLQRPDQFTLISGVAVVVLIVAMWRSLRRPVVSLSSGDVGRLEKLQQSLDVIALEVERLGESQRYLSKVLADGRAIGAGPAQEIGAVKREDVPASRRSPSA